jgi:hypothetical protein
VTPAQASGHPNFVDDWPVQGPTDPGTRAADCWWMQNVLPAHPACVDCKGPIPMWAQNKGLLGEQVSFGGRSALGFALAAITDYPEVWTQLTAPQQTWVMTTLNTLNGLIIKTTKTTCPTWAPAIPAAAGCFQGWFNGAKLGLTNPDGSPVVLRTDGVFDQRTLDALRTTVAMNAKDFPTPFPGTEMAGTGTAEKKLSTGAVVSIGVAGATVLGGIIYVATRKKKRKSRR